MKHSSRPQSIGWFQSQYKEGRLVLRPPFQRKPVWAEKHRCSLIESVLMNVPIPELYVQVSVTEDGTEELGVVDGQQRLRTILQFIGIEREEDQGDSDDNNNSFTLDALPLTSPFRGKTFADVIGDARKQFFQYEICVRFLYTDDTKEIEDVFKRLNKFAMPLKAQELRNATYHGAFAKFSEQLADDEYWAMNRIVTPAAIRRMADIEMMSDFLIGLLHGPQGGSARIINQYYEQYEQYEDDFPDQNRVKRMFARARGTIERLMPNISRSRWGNRADFYSLFVTLGTQLETRELKTSKEKELRDCLMRFAEEVNKLLVTPTAKSTAGAKSYTRAIEKGSNDKARRTDRHEALVALIAPFLTGKK